MVRGCVALLLSLLLLCGCATSRCSGRFGDGSSYAGTGNTRMFRKFHLQKVEGDAASVTAASMSRRYPDLFRKSPNPGDIPVDVYVKQGKAETSGSWSFIFASLFSIIPSWTTVEQNYAIDIVVDGDDKVVPPSSCGYSYDFKLSIMSPLGLIPYGDREGCQRNDFSTGFSTPDIAGVIEDVMSASIAQQLTRHALDRLTIPDVDFTMEDGGEDK